MFMFLFHFIFFFFFFLTGNNKKEEKSLGATAKRDEEKVKKKRRYFPFAKQKQTANLENPKILRSPPRRVEKVLQGQSVISLVK